MVERPSNLEIAVNDARAELQFFRIALQVFYINVVGRAPEPLAMLREMKQDVVRQIAKVPVEPQTAQGDQRMKAMLEGHCSAFFDGLEKLAQDVVTSHKSTERPN